MRPGVRVKFKDEDQHRHPHEFVVLSPFWDGEMRYLLVTAVDPNALTIPAVVPADLMRQV